MLQKDSASLNEALKAKEAQQKAEAEARKDEHHELALDDTQRVKVLSPGRLVVKRFMRNRLAIVGTITLLVMFVFSFIVPVFYPYGQTETFFKYDTLTVSYAKAYERKDYVTTKLDENADVHFSVEKKLTSHIAQMEQDGVTEKEVLGDDGSRYHLKHLGDLVYMLTAPTTEEVLKLSKMPVVATYNSKIGAVMSVNNFVVTSAFENAFSAAVKAGRGSFTAGGFSYIVKTGAKNSYEAYSVSGCDFSYNTDVVEDLGLITVPQTTAFERAVVNAVMDEQTSFSYGGKNYEISGNANSGFVVDVRGEDEPALLATCLVLDSVETGASMSAEFTSEAMLALYGEREFVADGKTYTIKSTADGETVYSGSTPVAVFSNFVVRRYSGEDTLSLDFKRKAADAVRRADKSGRSEDFTYMLPTLDESGSYATNEDGSLSLVETTIHVTRDGTVDSFTLTCDQIAHLIDIYAGPSKTHIFGTDGDGFDILARMMYGGRISLLVGFVVVIIESVLGTIMGGIAGYFGGWVDNIIMRLVDIFYCIPTYPILIILGAFFDSIKLGSYARLAVMMAVMGFLGWAGTARMVRGQILSLREQEFMIAAEATGLATKRKIFRHLIPNVMPQLIVSATMGLGSVILTESTLSFLGLGVKHPLATWGTMINSITSSNENLVRYAYIWVPVGLLICLTVIAFNFVGDGLRDAFDPKMK